MTPLIALLALLASSPSTATEVRVDVEAPAGQAFDLAVTADDGSAPHHCTLPAPRGCSLWFSPGPLHLTLASGERVTHFRTMLPAEPSLLVIGSRYPAKTYLGVAMLAGGAAAGVAEGFLLAASATALSPSRGGGAGLGVVSAIFSVGGAILVGVVTLGLLGGGTALTWIGFAHASPTVELVTAEPPG